MKYLAVLIFSFSILFIACSNTSTDTEISLDMIEESFLNMQDTRDQLNESHISQPFYFVEFDTKTKGNEPKDNLFDLDLLSVNIEKIMTNTDSRNKLYWVHAKCLDINYDDFSEISIGEKLQVSGKIQTDTIFNNPSLPDLNTEAKSNVFKTSFENANLVGIPSKDVIGGLVFNLIDCEFNPANQ